MAALRTPRFPFELSASNRVHVCDVTTTTLFAIIYCKEYIGNTMMQTPEPEPEVAHTATDTSISELENRLDELWESYLALLDDYTKAQNAIKIHLNSGFLSLAKAQSSAPLGRRYGQDWYDERMKAERRVHVSSDASETSDDAITASLQRLSISLVQDPKKPKSEEHTEDSIVECETPQPTQQPSPPGTPEPETRQEPTNDKKPEEPEKPKPVNPLRWYGILVPHELRKAQSAFSAVVGNPLHDGEPDDATRDAGNSPIIDAVNAARALREIEGEIRKLRKAVRKADKVRSMVAK